MAVLRTSLVAFVTAWSSFVLTSASCGTKAIGIEDCREIEQTRCEAAQACGLIDDVKDCQLFYRDQCLAGLPGEDRPTSTAVEKCVATIRLAGECAAAGEATPLTRCKNAVSSGTKLQTACDVVREPEQTTECGFLIVEPPPEPEPDAAGAAGAAGASGEDAGAAGAPG